MSAPDAPKAAVLLIGNELLSGKIRDENGWHLAGVLRRRGIQLVEIATVPDDVTAIGTGLLRLMWAAPVVFTSGGVGPTHDDVTIEAIAAATGRPLERNDQMEAILREHYADRINDAALKMADVPRGTTLRAESGWPVLRLDIPADTLPPEVAPEHDSRVYILPGIPALLRAKVDALEALEGELPSAPGWTLCTVQTKLEESALAPLLDALGEEFPTVEIGSYPRWSAGPDGRLRSQVRVTIEASGALAEDAKAAQQALLGRLDPEVVLPDDAD